MSPALLGMHRPTFFIRRLSTAIRLALAPGFAALLAPCLAFAFALAFALALTAAPTARAACQSGDACGGESACSAGCQSFTCGPDGSFVPAGVLQEGAPCSNVTTGICESCTCGALGAQIFANELAGTSCGPAGETCDGAGLCLAPPPNSSSAIRPGALLVYYGIPSLINGAAGDLDVAAAELGRYDFVVLGAGLEVPPGEPGSSPEHADTLAILARPAMADTRVFGYIDLGIANTTSSLSAFSIAEIVQRADWWLNIVGADGIFLDDYGYDFCVSRARQNAAIAGIRALDPGSPVPIVANAFRPDDVFGVETSHAFLTPWCDATVPEATFVPNPDQTPSLISADDFYFYESHQLIGGEFEANDFAFDWQFKSQYLANQQATLDFGILSITTIDGADAYDENAFFYSWYSAALYGHAATGWGEIDFSAPTSLAPYHARPTVDLGDVFLTSPGQSPDFVEWSRQTDTGQIWIDTQTHESGFVPEPGFATGLGVGLLGLAGARRRSRRVDAGCDRS